MPCNCVFEAVITPKELATRHEGRSSKYSQIFCFRSGSLQCTTNRVLTCRRNSAAGILPDLAQALRKTGFGAGLLTVHKPATIGSPNVIGTPPFRLPEDRHPVREFEILERIRRRHFAW